MTVRLSKNEYSSLLKRVFQGLFSHSQDWAAMAETVLWLEMSGFDGAALLTSALGVDETMEPFSGDLVETKDPAQLILDCRGASALVCAHIAADIAVDTVRRHGHCRLELRNVRDDKGIIAVLYQCGRAGVFGQALWSGGSAVVQQALTGIETFISHNSQTVLICESEAELSEFSIPDKTTEEIRKAYYANLNKGILIEPQMLSKLERIASRILVEATEESRKGAGE